MDGVGLLAPNYVLPGKTAYADGLVLMGADLRGQMARSHTSPEAERKVFPMQVALYSVIRPSNALKIEGSYNFGPRKIRGTARVDSIGDLSAQLQLARIARGTFSANHRHAV